MNQRKTVANAGGASGASVEVVWGAAEIGRVINRSPRQTFHLLENGRLPATKMGATWTSTRRRLLATFGGEDA